MDQRRIELEERVAALCGERIAQVRYFEINYENDQTGWDTYKDRFHILDFGLDLEMESGQVYGFIWDREFVQYNISMRDGSIRDDITDCAVRDVTTEPAWAGLLHTPITEAQVYWGTWEETGSEGFTRQEIEAALRTTRAAKPQDQAADGLSFQDQLAMLKTLGATRPKGPVKYIHYPQDIVITIASGDKIYLCASQYREEQDGFDSSIDEITVIFREDIARHYHVGPHRIT